MQTPAMLRATETLTVSLGHALNLVLLLDSIAVGRALGGVDDLISQALRDGLDGTERRVTGTNAHQVHSLVGTAERGHIHSLLVEGRVQTGRACMGVAASVRVEGEQCPQTFHAGTNAHSCASVLLLAMLQQLSHT